MSQRLIYLLRHGQTEWNRQCKVMGWEEIPLNERGREQAIAAAAFLANRKIARIVTSPLRRAKETALLAAQRCPDAALLEDDRLKEFNLGRWSGMEDAELQRDPLYQAYLADPEKTPFPSGETLAMVLARAEACREEQWRLLAEGSLLLVSHAGVIKVLIASILRLPLRHFWIPQVGNASLTLLDVSGREPRLVASNVLPLGNYEETDF